jgi:phosphate transport system substrate-binding protein
MKMIWKQNKKITLGITLTTVLITATLCGCIGGDNKRNTSTLVIEGSTTAFPIVQAAAEAYMNSHDNVDIQVSPTGSGNGISGVGRGKDDVGMSSREATSQELTTYQNLNKTTIAIDAIAIIVNPSNPVNNLTLEELRGIYNGTIKNWDYFGVSGWSGAIVVVGRDSASGTREYFTNEIMKKEAYVSGMIEESANAGVQQDIIKGQKSIGYVGLGYLNNQVKAIALKNTQGNYITPSVQTVKDQTYPIWRYLYLYTNGAPTGLAKDFIDFILSSAGQQIVEEQGFVRL